MTRSTVALSTRGAVAEGDGDVVLVDDAGEVEVVVAVGVPPPDDPLHAEQTRTTSAAAVLLAAEGLIPRASMEKGDFATARLRP
jgi:hypothetical protein